MSAGKRTPDHLRDEIVRLGKQGKSCRAIEAHLAKKSTPVNRTTIAEILRQADASSARAKARRAAEEAIADAVLPPPGGESGEGAGTDEIDPATELEVRIRQGRRMADAAARRGDGTAWKAIVNAMGTLAAKLDRLRPKPPPDPDADPWAIKAREQLIARVEQLVLSAEQEARAA